MANSSSAMLYQVWAWDMTTSGLPVSQSSISRSGSKYSIAQPSPLASSALNGSMTVPTASRPRPTPASVPETQLPLWIEVTRPSMPSARLEPVHGCLVDWTSATSESFIALTRRSRR